MPTKTKSAKLPPSRAKVSSNGSAAKSAGKGAGKAAKYVYTWGAGKADGDGSMKPLLGGKGANLAEMTRIGLPVPPGFTITTDVCTYFYAHKRSYPTELQSQMEAGIRNMEKIMGCKFGDAKGMPLLVAVRSGARDSMPGMMDTILNLGLNDQTVIALVNATKNERFAWDCYRRFIQMYGDVVMGVQKRAGEEHEPFEVVIEEVKHEHHEENVDDAHLTVEDYKELVSRFKKLVKERTGKSFPNDPWDQLRGAAGAVFGSWMNDRAIVYRRKYNIPSEWGTAVNVQAMVYGNTGENSGSGVAFTRNPANGANEFYGEFLINAQGEDVVAGVRTPEPVANLKKEMPKSYAELLKVRATLEKHFKDVQDVEFTIQDGKLFMLQTRNGKRTAAAALKFSMDMHKEKLIDWETAILRNPADQLEQLLAPIFDLAEMKKAKELAKGLPAGPGAASGKIYLNADRAAAAADKGERVLLVRNETSPEDLRGMIAAEGILTAKGGVSSHAALVARQMGKVCICGASAVLIDYDKKTVTISGEVFNEGDYLSIDGTSGTVYGGQLKTSPSEIITGMVNGDKAAQKTEKFKSFQQLMKWCSQATRLAVRTNADNPEQTEEAVAFGATGIGLTRTEHMFFEGDRIDAVREMILAETEEGRRAALKKILPYQKEDFIGIFKALKGFPATIRLLDPPLHEFVPHEPAAQADLAKKLGISAEKVAARVHALHEFNPMLGHRGCRLGIAYPEITETQARAIFEAAAEVQKKGIKVKPEVMIPLVGFKKELDLQVAIVHQVAAEVQKEKKVKLNYQVGTMIEVPRGALTADEIAQTAEFFSFGTNDLTQTGLGISRDDMGNFLNAYTENEIFKKNPFASLDQTGVGQLVKIAVEKGRSTRPDIKLGICGEHGGDPDSVKFFHKVGLNYVSCSPRRVPVARLAAAQAAIEEKRAAAASKKK
ncbi:pyruvate, phosphate dikinase [Chthoniobacter flavus Ellin428]|uniref:Pyruvate, phosphate dikinase n=1 Tax=Chthoniobacter flavus Ellin428 TaxID=497964 RepID=B4D6M4_9BACT|nr:pyruvate, phosphate dikinase [Chthoniobacter flavus]EDY17825.1 pyruvate, phosphate dikinase [Chthoniobacter flavus Ellin428]TCO88436.1 pyruvate phosphate dikinase [Chthoniobacter flavus]